MIKRDKETLKKLEQVLLKYFGYPAFRPGQDQIVLPLALGQDALAILPTGGGKSICFQVPGLFLGGTTIVISPLISLMQDQVKILRAAGGAATFINSTLELVEQEQRYQKLLAGEYQFLYLAPEKLLSKKFIAVIRRVNVALVAIDEAHCVSVWGHDFRPHYLQIGEFIRVLPKRPVVAAFSATANKRAQVDIVKYCGLKNLVQVQRSFARDNLHIFVRECLDEQQKILFMLFLLQKFAGKTGIIYVLTRKDARRYADLLNRLRAGLAEEVAIYHGGLDKDERTRIQAQFINGEQKVIVATNAFGMGVDQPNVRFVIHAQISSNLENYFQEIGRGGRDGQAAYCFALWTALDLQISADFIARNTSASKEQIKILKFKLAKVKEFLAYKGCRQEFVLNYFDEMGNFHCGICDNCRGQPLKFNQQVLKKLAAGREWRRQYARENGLIEGSVVTDLTLLYLAILPWREMGKLTVIPGVGRGLERILLGLKRKSNNAN